MTRRDLAGGEMASSAGHEHPDACPPCRELSDNTRPTPLHVWLSEAATLLLLIAALYVWAALTYGLMGD